MGDSSSSSSDGLDELERLILEHIPELRAYSLDPEVVERYYNKGYDAPEGELTPLSSSSSSEDPTSATVEVALNDVTRSFLDPDGRLPEDLQFHVYDQGENIVAPVKVPGEDRIIISVGADSWPASFQINVEHPRYRAVRIKFSVPEPGSYAHVSRIARRTFNERRRITEDYKNYLLGWLQDFWDARDAGTGGTLTFTSPAPNHPIDPFEHARDRIAREYLPRYEAAAQANPPMSTLAARKKMFVEGRNFLGVSPEIWDCIKGKGVDNEGGKLYKNVESETYNVDDPTSLFDSQEWKPNSSFNCRAFTVASARYLNRQMREICPSATAQHLLLKSQRHAIVYVDLGGCDGEPGCDPECCAGSFVYEPQSGETWDDGPDSDFSDDLMNYMEDKNGVRAYYPELDYVSDTLDGYPSGDDEGWIKEQNRIDWHTFPEEVQRISDLVCGCLASPQASNAMETYMRQKCQDGTFGDWFKENFRSGPGLIRTTDPDMPQMISCSTPRICQKSVSFPIDLGALATECGCEEDSEGKMTQEECQSYCSLRFRCLNCDSAQCLPSELYEDHPTTQQCEEKCAEGVDFGKTKTLQFGTAQDWFAGRIGDAPDR